MSDIENILEQSKVSGGGRFSLDVVQALEKLSHYQLQDPATFVLKLVQWAVASRPTAVHVQVAGGEISVSHDGRAVPRQQATLGLWGAHSDPALFDLGVAISASLRLNPLSISFASHDAEGAYNLDLLASTREPILLPVDSDRVTSLTVRGLESRPLPALKEAASVLGGYLFIVPFLYFWGGVFHPLFGQLLGGLSLASGGVHAWHFLRDAPYLRYPEFSLVRFRCQHACVPLYLNGRPINRPWFGISARYTQADVTLDITPSLDMKSSQPLVIAEEGCTLPGPGSDEGLQPLPYLRMWGKPLVGCRALMYRDAPGKNGYAAGRIIWVKQGVILDQRDSPSMTPGMVVVACADDLDVDLSQFSLVDNEAYRRVHDQLCSRAQEHAEAAAQSRSVSPSAPGETVPPSRDPQS